LTIYNAECSYAKSGILFIVMLSVIMLSVIMLSVVILNAIMLSVVILNVVMLSVVVPPLLNILKLRKKKVL
jgi:hypothetical protein